MSFFAGEYGHSTLRRRQRSYLEVGLDDGDIFHAVQDQSSKFLGRGLSASGPIHCSGTTLHIPAANTRYVQHVPCQKCPKSVLSNFFILPCFLHK